MDASGIDPSSRSMIAHSSSAVATLPVQDGLSRLHEARLGHERPELAGGLDPLDAPHEARELLLEPGSWVGEMPRHAVRQVLRLADVQERVVLAVDRDRRRVLPAARRRAPGRAAAAGAKCRSAVARSRRVLPRATSRARCRGTRRARARHRARGGALRRRFHGGSSRHRGCGRARRASTRARGAPCTAPARESAVRGVGTRCAGSRSRSARCARRTAGPRPARRCHRRRPRMAARPRPWPR